MGFIEFIVLITLFLSVCVYVAWFYSLCTRDDNLKYLATLPGFFGVLSFILSKSAKEISNFYSFGIVHLLWIISVLFALILFIVFIIKIKKQ